MTRIRELFSGVAVACIVVGLVVSILLSPLALQALARKKLNWSLLSNIGQSYGAASAVLSALAFFAVAVALILQVRQARESRGYSIREIHSSLLRIAMENHKYLDVWGAFPAPGELDRDVVVYANLVMNYLALLHETKTSDLREVKYHVAAIFDGATGRAYWESCRDVWLKFSRGRSKALAKVIDDEYQRAIASGPPKRPMRLAAIPGAPGERLSLRARIRDFLTCCSRTSL